MINNDLDKNIEYIKKEYFNSKDLTFKKINIKDINLSLVFINTLTSDKSINEFILKSFSTLIKDKKKASYKNILNFFINVIPGDNIKEVDNYDELFTFLGNGFTGIIFNKEKKCIVIETKGELSRSISQPITEQTISGPKDSFTENYITNIGLVRKRIKTKELVLEEIVIGKQTKTKIGILYMNNIIEYQLLDQIKEKLNNINIDGILDATYIRELIDSQNSAFPLIRTTERPDLVSLSLLEGKICITVENSPYMLIIPTFFIDLFYAPEDYYQKPKNVTFTRIIRLFAFFIAILLPAFYLAITTYNHETIPITLIVNFAAQRQGVPFPAIIEALGMSLVFEILRESDIRMPSLSGSAISILGAIVLGDAAVTAGIVSPIMVIVVAMSAICNLMFSSVAMVNAIRLWRIIFMLFATFLGLPGIYFGIFLFIIIICSLKSFGKPYMFPIAPINFNLFKGIIIKKDIKNDTKRNPLLTDKNYTKEKKL